ncbi:hypothetical protein VTN00DRAFT_4883 [Thermoascus crustaceus]|uniref:uncharacterized protein n=1 Tax=Thermoascus crustaceus TaxID=5088 RepID=UPI0037448420
MAASSISKEEYAEILSNFILEIGYRMPTWGLNFSPQAPVTSYFERQPWDPNIKTKAMSPGLGMCYPYLSREVQIAHAIFATYVLHRRYFYPEKSHLEIFLPIIPDLIDFINYVNDIFSFYKESVIGSERLNFICNLAQAQSMSSLDALRSTCANVVQNVHNVRKVLSKHPQMLNTTEPFLCGYISLYLSQDRYRLSEMELLDANGKQTDGRGSDMRHRYVKSHWNRKYWFAEWKKHT